MKKTSDISRGEGEKGQVFETTPDPLSPSQKGELAHLPAAVRRWLTARYLADPTPGQLPRIGGGEPEPIVFVRYEEFAEYLLNAGFDLLPNLDDWKNAGWIEDLYADLTSTDRPTNPLPYYLARLNLPLGRHRLVGIRRTVLDAPTEPDLKISQESEGIDELPTGKVPGVVSLNVLRAHLEMTGFPDWRARLGSWTEVPFLRLRCATLFPGQPFSAATIELLMAWFQEKGLTADQARHLPLPEAVRRLQLNSRPPAQQPLEAQQYVRFLELHALATAPEHHQVPFETFGEYQRLLTKFGVYPIDGVSVGPPDPTRVPRSEPILNTDCVSIPGKEPLVCPRSSPKPPAELLPRFENRLRELRLVGQDQTILWVGRQARMDTLCMYQNGCGCFAENAMRPPTVTEKGEVGTPPSEPAPTPEDFSGLHPLVQLRRVAETIRTTAPTDGMHLPIESDFWRRWGEASERHATFVKRMHTLADTAVTQIGVDGHWSALGPNGPVLRDQLSALICYLAPDQLADRGDVTRVMDRLLRADAALAQLRPAFGIIASLQNQAASGAARTRERNGDGKTVAVYDELRQFARANLKGQERATIESLCDAMGEIQIADLAVAEGLGWGDPFQGFKDVQRRLNPKLKRLGWRLERRDNAAALRQTGSRKRR